jgi:hypothetical protein
MSRKAAVIIAGGVTTVVMVLVFGLGGFATRLNGPSSAASSNDPQGTAAAVCANPSDVAALQSELKDYQSALQQANTQLQAAYDEITRLQSQGRFSGENEQNEGGFFNPFGGD